MGNTLLKRRDMTNFLLLAQMIRDEEEKLKGLKCNNKSTPKNITNINKLLEPKSHSSHSWSTFKF